MLYQPRQVNLSSRDAERLVKQWQKVLRLDDWRITVKICRSMDIAGTLGAVRILKQSKEAKMQLLDPIDFSDPDSPHDMEVTLVHELLHLSTDAFDPPKEGCEHMHFEIALNTIAEALVGLKRHGK
ncbi:MAG: hypothetical protein V3V92_02530 [Candidatus Hydrothermarchaeales archaeon]